MTIPTPLVSVILPTYNAEKYIDQALNTVIGQTYRPIEIIIVDDGSTDNTAKIIKQYQVRMTKKSFPEDFQIHYLFQENAGPSKARNFGVRQSRGVYITFLDADDSWEEKKLEKQVDLILKDERIDIVLSNARIFRATGKNSKGIDFFKKENLDVDFFGHSYIVEKPVLKLLKINFIHTSSILLKRSCFSGSLFFNENRKYAEDWELWLKMSMQSFGFAYLNKIYVNKNEDGGGLTSHRNKMLLSIIDVLDSFWIPATREALTSEETKLANTIVSRRYKWLGYHFFKVKHYVLACRLYIKSFLTLNNI